MLIIKNLSVSYGDVPVLENLSMELPAGCIHGLVGMNGSGKTTLFHTIYGWIKPDEGQVLWNTAPLNRKQIALLETKNYFYPRITGREYLSLFSPGPVLIDVNVWQQLFRLPLDDYIDTYSTGMKKKLALTAVLKLDKPILLLDEPFNGIDLEAVNIIKLLMKKLKEQGKTVIVTSHVLETLTHSCDYIHYLEKGSIVKTFDHDEVESIEKVLFKETEYEVYAMIEKGLV